MPHQVQTGVGFIRRVPCQGSNSMIQVSVEHMTRRYASHWNREIQPEIDRLSPPRADQGWMWPVLQAIAGPFAVGLWRRPAAYAVVYEHPTSGSKIPCAMMLLVGRYPALHLLGGRAVFVWFLASAPRVALDKFLPPGVRPQLLGSAALDVAVCHAFNAGLTGCVGLHAHQLAASMLKWYQGAA